MLKWDLPSDQNLSILVFQERFFHPPSRIEQITHEANSQIELQSGAECHSLSSI